VVVVPAVLWLSGFLGGGSQAKSVRAGMDVPTVKVEVKPFKTASIAAITPPAPPPAAESADPPAPQARSIEPPQVTAPAPKLVMTEPPRAVEPPRSRADDLLVLAKRRIEEAKDIAGARDILHQAPETAASAVLTFLLAETYDPNMLASWQTRGVTANPERARSLYMQARALGDSRAQQRLEWLTAN